MPNTYAISPVSRAYVHVRVLIITVFLPLGTGGSSKVKTRLRNGLRKTDPRPPAAQSNGRFAEF